MRTLIERLMVCKGIAEATEGAQTLYGPVGGAFTLTQDARYFSDIDVRGDDTHKDEFKRGDIVFLSSAFEDGDGFYWFSFVKDKALLGKAKSYSDRGVLGGTTVRLSSLDKYFKGA